MIRRSNGQARDRSPQIGNELHRERRSGHGQGITRSSSAAVEDMAHDLDHGDEVLSQPLATAGALVALADGRVETLERDEFVNFVNGRPE
jgi:hypothetical protein